MQQRYMSFFSYKWDHDSKSQSKLPVYGKNARKKIKKSALYISLWSYLRHNVYIYTRHFHNWEIYILFIARTFPNLKVDDFKEDLTELLSNFYIIHNRESMGTAASARNTTNDELNAFLDILKEKSIDTSAQIITFFCPKKDKRD